MVVACPGRLGDLIERGSIRLDAVEIVVLDEADRMADMGFLPDVKRLLDLTPATRQTLLFSATLDGDIDVLVRRYQNDPARHELEVDEDDASAAVHLFWRASSGDRVGVTADIAAAAGPTIVFSRTKHATDRIARQLEQRGIRAAAIHGDRSQKQREKALDLFVRGAVDALVATDVAARGIHVDGVNAVVHFDPPADAKDYVHRSGRTARAGATGVVVTLVTPDKAGAVKRLQRDLGVPIGTTTPDSAAITAVIGAPPARRPSQDHGTGAPHRPQQGPSEERSPRPGPTVDQAVEGPSPGVRQRLVRQRLVRQRLVRQRLRPVRVGCRFLRWRRRGHTEEATRRGHLGEAGQAGTPVPARQAVRRVGIVGSWWRRWPQQRWRIRPRPATWGTGRCQAERGRAAPVGRAEPAEPGCRAGPGPSTVGAWPPTPNPKSPFPRARLRASC